jgi:hypothetical protein
LLHDVAELVGVDDVDDGGGRVPAPPVWPRRRYRRHTTATGSGSAIGGSIVGAAHCWWLRHVRTGGGAVDGCSGVVVHGGIYTGTRS